ncbi:MAG TPA: selenocysteine-specific translation elongation factor [Vicinamibacterales bacterium]|nr:selenocysteine-specific translation elongation factor [Vicinamibacterales bacterium]
MGAIVVGTAGHIDHGKSALVEALTGIHPDRLKEERERGITIDLGFAHLSEGDTDIALVDVPGHERFVRNMLAGAGGIDAVLLVVAADESVMPQTREHFDICRLLGLDRGVVAITKCDLADADTRALVRVEVADLVAGTFLEGAPVVEVSARSGEGVDTLRATLAGLAGPGPRQGRAGVVRLPIDRVFTVRGFGTVVTGTLVSGRVAEGDELTALPSGTRVRVRGIQVHGTKASAVDAPQRAALNLGAADAGTLVRGVTLSTPGRLPVTRRVDVRVTLLAGAPPLAHGARVGVHHGTADALARVTLAAVREPTSDIWEVAEPGRAGVALPASGSGFARLRFDVPMVLTRGDRLVLRRPSPPGTIGGAVVLDPEPHPARLRRPSSLGRFLDLEDDDGLLRVWLREAAGRGLPVADLVRRGGLDPDRAARMRQAAVEDGRAVEAGTLMFEVARLSAAAERAVSALEQFHRTRPDEVGVPRDDLRHQVAPGAVDELFEAVIARLVGERRVAGTDRLRLASHNPTLGGERADTAAAIVASLAAAGLTPPDPGTLADVAGVSKEECRQVVQLLVRERAVAKLDGLLFHPDVLGRLRDEVSGLGAGRSIDVAWFKGRYGVSRKYAIPLLEWLDRERVTRRVGHARVVIAR